MCITYAGIRGAMNSDKALRPNFSLLLFDKYARMWSEKILWDGFNKWTVREDIMGWINEMNSKFEKN